MSLYQVRLSLRLKILEVMLLLINIRQFYFAKNPVQACIVTSGSENNHLYDSNNSSGCE